MSKHRFKRNVRECLRVRWWPRRRSRNRIQNRPTPDRVFVRTLLRYYLSTVERRRWLNRRDLLYRSVTNHTHENLFKIFSTRNYICWIFVFFRFVRSRSTFRKTWKKINVISINPFGTTILIYMLRYIGICTTFPYSKTENQTAPMKRRRIGRRYYLSKNKFPSVRTIFLESSCTVTRGINIPNSFRALYSNKYHENV